MSKRNLIIAAAVLVLLAVVSQWFGRSGNDNKSDIIGKPLLDSKQVEAFDELVIQNAEGKITLQKQKDQWTIAEKQDYPANVEKLLELMDKLTSSNVSSLATKDEKRLGYFQVVYWDDQNASIDNSGTQLILNSQNKQVFTMMAGKKRQSKSANAGSPSHPDGVYVRVGKNPAVYLIKENLNLETNPKDWIQTSLFKLDKKEIQSVLFEVSGERFKLERTEKGKNMALSGMREGQKTVEYEISSVLSDLEDFKFNELSPKSEIKEIDLALKSVVTVSMFNSPGLAFRVYNKPNTKKSVSGEDDGKYYVSLITSDNEASREKWQSLYNLGKTWMFEMEGWKAKRWIKTRKDFIEKK